MNEKAALEFNQPERQILKNAMQELLKKRSSLVADNENARLEFAETPVPALGDKEAEKLYDERKTKIRTTKELIESIDQSISTYQKNLAQ